MTPFRPDLLAGKVALVSGGGSGIGFGIARAFVAHGARVALFSRDQAKIDRAVGELGGTPHAFGVVADVRQPDQVGNAIDVLLERAGRISIVVNNAAGNFLAPAAALSPNGFRTVLDIDANGTFITARMAFDRVLRDHGGVVLNISATLHHSATPLQIHASAAKAAVDAITRNLAVEWGPLGIRVVGIAPGPIDGTEGMARLAPGDVKAALAAEIPLRRLGTIEDIANAALFLVSEAGAYINGSTLVVDGGAWLSGARLAAMAGR